MDKLITNLTFAYLVGILKSGLKTEIKNQHKMWI